MMRAAVVALALIAVVSGCATMDKLLRKDDSAKLAKSLQQFVQVVELAAEQAQSRGWIDDAQAAYVSAAVERAKAVGTEGNISLAKFMLLQIVGELPAQAVVEAQDEVGVTVGEALVVDGGSDIDGG